MLGFFGKMMGGIPQQPTELKPAEPIIGSRYHTELMPEEITIIGNDGETMPIHYALIEENAEGIMDKRVDQEAKDSLRQLAERYPQEIRALSGKSVQDVKAALESLAQQGQ